MFHVCRHITSSHIMHNISVHWLLADHFHLRILADALTLINLKRAAEFSILLKGTSEMVPLTAA